MRVNYELTATHSI